MRSHHPRIPPGSRPYLSMSAHTRSRFHFL
uniref:Uncharacterized protein n=2 Tax=Anguilla anguilla TaxID=7936 RepID=A0A0E9UDF6_ANGAN